MDPTHAHLVLNHVPVLGTLAGIVLLIAGMGLRSADLKRAGLVGLLVAALAAVPVYLTGEPAEETVESIAGVSKAVVEEHESSGKLSLMAIGLLGVVSATALLASRRAAGLPAALTSAVLIGSVAVGGLMVRTANLGGQIRHSEIRSASAFATDGGSLAPETHAQTNDEGHEHHRH